jgi:carbon monoxide dehydrogenase subunit G
MDLKGEYLIGVPAAIVWAGMNDAALLKRCIPICESFERVSETLFTTVMRIKVGPFRTHFTIDIAIEDAAPPLHYRLVAEGRGGIAGFAKGSADVTLVSQGEQTLLQFSAASEFQGAIARLASKVMEGTAKRYADEFFADFAREVGLDNRP